MSLKEAHELQRREVISLRAKVSRLEKQLSGLFPIEEKESLERHIRHLEQLNKTEKRKREETRAHFKEMEYISRVCLEMEGMNELPYFNYRLSETSIYEQNRKIEDSYYKTTALKTVCDHISDMSEKHLFFNLEIIRHSFSECLIKEQGIKRTIERKLTPVRHV